MKSTSFLALAAFAAASFLSSCQQDPQSVNSGINLPLKSSPPPANPAIAYINGSSVGVMDTTGTNMTNIVTASSGTMAFPSWNYSGGSITYGLYGTTSWAVNAFDVSVNSKGIPVASNARTIYSLTSSDSIRLQSGPAWCATSSTNEIAFTRLHTDKANFGVTDLCTIPQPGGTPTVLASYKRLSSSGIVLGLYENPTWSPDDSKIAVLRQDTNLHFTILIFNASTGAAEDSIPVIGGCSHLEWSRSGINQLMFSLTPNSSTPWDLYYVAPSTGSTPTTNSVVGTNATWSPNNSGIMYTDNVPSIKKVVPFTPSTSTVLSNSNGIGYLDWKR